MTTFDFIVDRFATQAQIGSGFVFAEGFNRVDLARLFCQLGFRAGAEIGVMNASYTITLARLNKKATIYAIDAWKSYAKYSDNTDDIELAQFKRKAKERLSFFSNVEIVQKFSMDAVEMFKDNSLDFVYIDANHELPFVTEDIYYWSRKVRDGGIVAGHDWLDGHRKDGKCHVRSALIGYADAFDISTIFVIGKPTIARSWFYVKGS